MPTAREAYGALCTKVDAFFDRVARQHARTGGITCHPACTACCRRFSVTGVEADALREATALLDEPTRAALRDRSGEATETCPALDADGRCIVYGARPLICRTHGLAIRFAYDDDTTRIESCPKNFTDGTTHSLAPSDILDQRTLSTILLAVNQTRAIETGTAPDQRTEIEDVFLSS